MHPLSDKDLDRISRQAAEQTDVDQPTSGWEQLEKRLNKELPQEKEKDRKRFLWLFLLLLLLSGAGVAYLVAKSDKKTTANSTSSDSIKGKPSAGNQSSPGEANTSSTSKKAEQSENAPLTAPHADKPTSNPADDIKPGGLSSTSKKSERSVDTSTTSKLQPRQSQIDPNKFATSNKKVRGLNNSNNDKIVSRPLNNFPITSNSKTTDTTQVDIIDSEKYDGGDKETISAVVQVPLVSIDTIAIVQVDTTKKEPSIVVDSPAVQSGKKTKSPNSTLSRFSITAIAGMDYSRVHSTGSNKPGYNFGAMVNYNFSDRWAVSVGLIQTKKNYSAKGKDFTPPKGSWLHYVDLKTVDGNCSMWDIPVNVRYNLVASKKSNIYLTTGLSSYIMRNQSYTYAYDYNGVATVRDWSTSSTQNEWFKILNLSAGWESKINQSWSLQAEPFIKVPLAGVGHGELDISSYGLLLGIKYSPGFNKKKTTSSIKQP
ncbi:MAG: porin family protein [Chitinophagaceae bacterium]|nr:porin family protein [Chitinophagaceae bacterium]